MVGLILAIAVMVLLVLSACSTPENAKKGYLVTVESPSSKVGVHKLSKPQYVDSIVIRNYGYAIPEFNSDSLFSYSPYFKIETINKIVYGEEKELVTKNGKIKFKKIRK